MSIRVTGGRDFPSRINLSNMKIIKAETESALAAIMLAKAASQGTFEDLASLWAGVNSNATVVEPMEELTKHIKELIEVYRGGQPGEE